MGFANAGTNLVEMHFVQVLVLRAVYLFVLIFLCESFRVAPVTQKMNNLVGPLTCLRGQAGRQAGRQVRNNVSASRLPHKQAQAGALV